MLARAAVPAGTGVPRGDGEIMMRQLLLLLLGRIWRGAPHMLSSGLPVVGLALVVVGCATPSLMPPAQAVAVRDRDRALAPHAAAIPNIVSTTLITMHAKKRGTIR